VDAAPWSNRQNLQTACKPGSVRVANHAGRPFLCDAHCCAPGATNPGNGAGMPLRHMVHTMPPAAPIRSCSRWGLPCRLCCQRRGALLPHRFTLACVHCCVPAVCFLWHCPWGRPRRPLAGTVFPWSPDFPPMAGYPATSGRPAVWRCAACARHSQPSSMALTANSRATVPRSAWPVIASGRQWRWKARNTVARSRSSPPCAPTP